MLLRSVPFFQFPDRPFAYLIDSYCTGLPPPRFHASIPTTDDGLTTNVIDLRKRPHAVVNTSGTAGGGKWSISEIPVEIILLSRKRKKKEDKNATLFDSLPNHT